MDNKKKDICRFVFAFAAAALLIATGKLYSQITADVEIPVSDVIPSLSSGAQPGFSRDVAPPQVPLVSTASISQSDSSQNSLPVTSSSGNESSSNLPNDTLDQANNTAQAGSSDNSDPQELYESSNDFMNSTAIPSLARPVLDGSPSTAADSTNKDFPTADFPNSVESGYLNNQPSNNIPNNISSESERNRPQRLPHFSENGDSDGKRGVEMIQIPFSDPAPPQNSSGRGFGPWRGRFNGVFSGNRSVVRTTEYNSGMSGYNSGMSGESRPWQNAVENAANSSSADSFAFAGMVPPDVLREISSRHSWGKFSEGAWKRLGETTEVYSMENGRCRKNFSSAEHTLTLCSATAEQYRLVWESAMIGSSRRWSAPPKITTTNFWDEKIELLPVAFERKLNQAIVLEGASIPCQWEKITFKNAQWQVEIETWRSDKSRSMPAVLRQLRRTYSNTANYDNTTNSANTTGAPQPGAATTVQNASADGNRIAKRRLTISTEYTIAPTPSLFSVLGTVQQVWKAVQKDVSVNGRVETTSLISQDVPGEIISYETLQYDKTGTVIGKISGKLLDYGLDSSGMGSAEGRKGALNLKIWHRPNLFRNNLRDGNLRDNS